MAKMFFSCPYMIPPVPGKNNTDQINQNGGIMTAVQTYPAVWHHTGCQSEKLTENLTCDAAIVGGGLTGVSLAYLLGERGFSTVLHPQR